MRLLIKLLMRIGLISSGPAVSSITSATQAEGTSLVHTVTLASAVAVIDGLYPFSLSGVTATSGTDYTATPTFSAGVTRSGNTLTVPVGVSSFTITVSTTDDAVFEGTETYSITVGGMTNTGTITDDESAPTIASVSSASATEGSNIVHTVAVTGTAQASRTFAFAFSGAAVGGTDYNATPTFSAGVTLSGGNITVPAGVTSFTVTVATINNASVDGSRAYTLTIGGASGTGSISDDDAPSPAFTVTMTALSNATGTVTTLAYINPGSGGGGSSPAFTATLTALTNATGTVTTPAYINAGSGSTLTLSVDESVASGVAPLAVFFDATASTSTQTTRPMHDVTYWWDFGDTSAGTWSNGTGANTSRNSAYGPVACHMFETAGTKTVTLWGYDGVTLTSTTKTITVTAADTEWAGTKTVCYSTGAAPVPGVNGVPTGATCVGGVTDISASYLANKGTGNKRHLLQAGDTFAIASSLTIDVGGPSMIGKFGSGANPIINSTLTGTAVIGLSKSTTPTGVSDWRFQDFSIDCNNQNNASAFGSNGSHTKMLINRVYMTRCFYGLLMSGSTIDAANASVPFTHAMWDQTYMVDSTVYDLYTSASGPNATFACGSRAAIMGCNINNNLNGEHGIRFQYCNLAVFNNNTIQGVAPGKVNITIRGYNFAGGNTLAAGQYSEKVVISDNTLVGGDSSGIMGIAPQNDGSDERGRNYIVERNWFNGATATQYFITVAQTDVTIRNNFAYAPGNTGGAFVTFKPENAAGVTTPTRGHVYNNSFYHAATGSGYFALVSLVPNVNTMSGCTFETKNNILYSTGSNMNITGNTSSGTNTASNNTTSISTAPGFATVPPTAIAHFTPGSGSYAQAAGTNVKNWKDFYGTSTQATPDMGAVVI